MAKDRNAQGIEGIREIVSQLAVDAGFRKSLRADPTTTLSTLGYRSVEPDVLRFLEGICTDLDDGRTSVERADSLCGATALRRDGDALIGSRCA